MIASADFTANDEMCLNCFGMGHATIDCPRTINPRALAIVNRAMAPAWKAAACAIAKRQVRLHPERLDTRTNTLRDKLYAVVVEHYLWLRP